MDAFESGVLDLPGFYFTGDDYRYRFEPETKQRFLDSLRERFNSGVGYKGRALKWDTVIEQKTVELCRYLVGRMNTPDFTQPSPKLNRTDSKKIRRQILTISPSQAQMLGIRVSTLHYLRSRAKGSRPFEIYEPVRKRLKWRGENRT